MCDDPRPVAETQGWVVLYMTCEENSIPPSPLRQNMQIGCAGRKRVKCSELPQVSGQAPVQCQMLVFPWPQLPVQGPGYQHFPVGAQAWPFGEKVCVCDISGSSKDTPCLQSLTSPAVQTDLQLESGFVFFFLIILYLYWYSVLTVFRLLSAGLSSILKSFYPLSLLMMMV